MPRKTPRRTRNHQITVSLSGPEYELVAARPAQKLYSRNGSAARHGVRGR